MTFLALAVQTSAQNSLCPLITDQERSTSGTASVAACHAIRCIMITPALHFIPPVAILMTPKLRHGKTCLCVLFVNFALREPVQPVARRCLSRSKFTVLFVNFTIHRSDWRAARVGSLRLQLCVQTVNFARKAAAFCLPLSAAQRVSFVNPAPQIETCLALGVDALRLAHRCLTRPEFTVLFVNPSTLRRRSRAPSLGTCCARKSAVLQRADTGAVVLGDKIFEDMPKGADRLWPGGLIAALDRRAQVTEQGRFQVCTDRRQAQQALATVSAADQHFDQIARQQVTQDAVERLFGDGKQPQQIAHWHIGLARDEIERAVVRPAKPMRHQPGIGCTGEMAIAEIEQLNAAPQIGFCEYRVGGVGNWVSHTDIS